MACIDPNDERIKNIRRKLHGKKRISIDKQNKEDVLTDLRTVLSDQDEEVQDMVIDEVERHYFSKLKNKYIKELDKRELDEDLDRIFRNKAESIEDRDSLRESVEGIINESMRDPDERTAKLGVEENAKIIEDITKANGGTIPIDNQGRMSPEFMEAYARMQDNYHRSKGYSKSQFNRAQRGTSASMLSLKSLTVNLFGDTANILLRQPMRRIEAGAVGKNVGEMKPEKLRRGGNLFQRAYQAGKDYYQFGIDTPRLMNSLGNEKYSYEPHLLGDYLVHTLGKEEVVVDGEIQARKVDTSFQEEVVDKYSNLFFKAMGGPDTFKASIAQNTIHDSFIPKLLEEDFGLNFDEGNRNKWDTMYEVLDELGRQPNMSNKSRNDLKNRIKQIEENNKTPLSGDERTRLIDSAVRLKDEAKHEIRMITHQGEGWLSNNTKEMRNVIDKWSMKPFIEAGMSEETAQWFKFGTWLNPFITTASNIAEASGEVAGVNSVARTIRNMGVQINSMEGNNRLGRVDWGKALKEGKFHRPAIYGGAVAGLALSVNPEHYLGDYPQSQREKELMKARGISPGTFRVGGMNIPTSYLGPMEPSFRSFMKLRQEYAGQGGDQKLGMDMISLSNMIFSQKFNEIKQIGEQYPQMNGTVNDFFQFWDKAEQQGVTSVEEGESVLGKFGEFTAELGASLITRPVPSEIRDFNRVTSMTRSRRDHLASRLWDDAFGLTWGEDYISTHLFLGGMSDKQITALGDRVGPDKQFSPEHLTTIFSEMLGFEQTVDDDPLINELQRLHVREKEQVMPTSYIENIEGELPEEARVPLQKEYGQRVRQEMESAIREQTHTYEGRHGAYENVPYEFLPDKHRAKVLREAEDRVKKEYMNSEYLQSVREHVKQEKEM